MPTTDQMRLAEILRKPCAANGLGTTGSSTTLLNRLVSANKKTSSKAQAEPKAQAGLKSAT